MIGTHIELMSVSKAERVVLIILRAIEYVVIKTLDALTFVKNKSISLISRVIPRYEYYLQESTGSVLKRRFRGNKGIFKYMQGYGMVRIADEAEYVPDDFTCMGWTEQMSGQYDEALGYIGSKQEYREKMKEKGWVNKDHFTYSKKTTEQRIKENIAKRDKRKDYEAFNRAVSMAESMTGHNFN